MSQYAVGLWPVPVSMDLRGCPLTAARKASESVARVIGIARIMRCVTAVGASTRAPPASSDAVGMHAVMWSIIYRYADASFSVLEILSGRVIRKVDHLKYSFFEDIALFCRRGFDVYVVKQI